MNKALIEKIKLQIRNLENHIKQMPKPIQYNVGAILKIMEKDEEHEQSS